jgi:hypothetical protein
VLIVFSEHAVNALDQGSLAYGGGGSGCHGYLSRLLLSVNISN